MSPDVAKSTRLDLSPPKLLKLQTSSFFSEVETVETQADISIRESGCFSDKCLYFKSLNHHAMNIIC